MKEDIISFLKDEDMDYPFFLEMTGISYCDGTYEINRSKSPIYVFEYVIKGQGYVKEEDREFTASEGDLYILHKGNNHNYHSDDKNPWVKIWFNIKGSLVDSLMEAYRLNSINYIKSCQLGIYFYKILEAAKSSTENRKETLDAIAIIFHVLIQKIALSAVKDTSPYSINGLKLKNYLDNHITESINIKKLSQEIYRSPSQTIRIFKKDFDLAPYEYLLKKRLELGRMLLLNTNLSIKEIAFKLGFKDEHYFSAYFKSKLGLAPTDLRKDQGKK